MKDYARIQNCIDRARAQRSVHLARLVSGATAAGWNGIKNAANGLLSVARTRTGKGLFTFDA